MAQRCEIKLTKGVAQFAIVVSADRDFGRALRRAGCVKRGKEWTAPGRAFNEVCRLAKDRFDHAEVWRRDDDGSVQITDLTTGETYQQETLFP